MAVHELDDAAIEAEIAANLMGPWPLARAAAQSMLAAGGGYPVTGTGIAAG